MNEETKEQKQIYAMFRGAIYLTVALDALLYAPLELGKIGGYASFVARNVFFLNSLLAIKTTEIVLVLITCMGTTAMKKLKFNARTMVMYPLVAGIMLTATSILMQTQGWLTQYDFLRKMTYVATSWLGIAIIHAALDNIAKYISTKLGDDRFNFENESFQQTEKLIKNDYSVNIPMLFYYKKHMRKGWINIVNPFRATLVLGTPGSGKSFGVIDPFIRQHSAKGFAMMVYDYKFPTLAKKAFYAYNKNKKLRKIPKNCGFHVVNFTDVEYSHRINPIQAKYIPTLAAASETAATLIESLQKGGDNKGGSEQFFKKSAENFLASIIYFFVNFRKTGYKNGKRLTLCVDYQGERIYIKTVKFMDYLGFTTRNFEEGTLKLNFINERGENIGMDDDGMPRDLNGYEYFDENRKPVLLGRSYYVDENDNEVEPDTYTGMYSDMPHVLAFLGLKYDEIFEVLMMDPAIQSLMAPFKSAWENKAMDQLEGMTGTLRVQASALVTKESYWVFSGDDFDLKISDRQKPSYLIIANDPELEKITGALNALVLNRLVTKVNTQGNLPVSIIVDELPTLYFYGIDRLIGTARSNKVAVTLGFQELPQLEADYGKVGMQKVITTVGNVISGSARFKETLEWLSNDIAGKAKQLSRQVSISDRQTSTSISEKMDSLVPASKIADMRTGWLFGQTAADFTPVNEGKIDIEKSAEFQTTKFFCKTNFDMAKIKEEENHYVDLPKFYTFKNEREKDILLNENFTRINNEVKMMVNELLEDVRALEMESEEMDE